MWAFRPLLRNEATVTAGGTARRGRGASGAPGGPQAGTRVHWAPRLQTISQVPAGGRVHMAAFTPSPMSVGQATLRHPLTFTKSLWRGGHQPSSMDEHHSAQK